MFTKSPRASHSNFQDDQPTASIDRLHPVDLEPVPTFEPPTILNGSVIGSDLTILGENINIVSKETLQIDGEIHGDVSGKKINIGVGGKVVGTISAAIVEIDGGVKGTVRAQEVRLNSEAKVTGDLVHQTLVVSQGAEFEGSVRRSQEAFDLTPNLDVDASLEVSKESPPELSPEFYAEPLKAKPLKKPTLHIDG